MGCHVSAHRTALRPQPTVAQISLGAQISHDIYTDDFSSSIAHHPSRWPPRPPLVLPSAAPLVLLVIWSRLLPSPLRVLLVCAPTPPTTLPLTGWFFGGPALLFPRPSFGGAKITLSSGCMRGDDLIYWL